MDLSVLLDKTKLNIRVSVILKTPSGYIFEADKSDFYFPIGGRIQLNENSVDAAIREVFEEIGLEIKDLEYIATLENFFNYDGIDFHEINIVHKVSVNDDIILPVGFYFIKKDDFKNINIKPSKIVDIIESEDVKPQHFIINEKK